MAEIKPIEPSDIDEIVGHCVTVFHNHGMSDEAMTAFTRHITDWSISRKLVLNDTIIGFYLLHEASIIKWQTERRQWAEEYDCVSVLPIYDNCEIKEDLNKYVNRDGVEGIILAVLPTYRGFGYGRMLKELPKIMGYDYVYGEQLKDSHNLHHWLKSRRVVAECDGIWVTLQDYV